MFQWSKLAEDNNKLLYRLNVWFYSFFLKVCMYCKGIKQCMFPSANTVTHLKSII
jgi:hypothetical protein